MNYTDTSIANLEAISRSRELTDAETDEMARLVKQQKQNTARRWYYATLPSYRNKRKKKTPEQLKRNAERRRERAANDPAYRALRNAQSHTGRKRCYRARSQNTARTAFAGAPSVFVQDQIQTILVSLAVITASISSVNRLSGKISTLKR